MLEVSCVFFLVCVDEYHIERGGSGREGFYGFYCWTEDDIDLVDETCGGEILGCNFDADRIDLQGGDFSVLWKRTGKPSGRVPGGGGQRSKFTDRDSTAEGHL